MRLFSIATLLLLRLGLAQAVYSLDEVEAQIEAFLDQNGTLTTRNLPSGCAVAVRNLS